MSSKKHNFSDYTRAEFFAVIEELIHAAGTPLWQDRLLEHFIAIVEHPDGSDLLYYPTHKQTACADEIIERIITWRKTRHLPLFKDA